MNILVCVKRVADPEAPARQFKVDEAAMKVIPSRSVPWLTSTYDESALEAALQLKDQVGGRVTLLSLAAGNVSEWLQEVLATGADDAILVQDEQRSEGDGLMTAEVLAAAARKMGGVDVILCGRQASDTDAGIVGSAMAEMLGVPSASVTRKVTTEHGKLRVERALEDGYEVLEMDPPALLNVTSEQYQLRYATLPNIMAASMKEVTIWTSADLGLGPARSRVRLRRLSRPSQRMECQFVQADTPEAAAYELARLLRANASI